MLARIFLIHSDRNSENFILSVGLPGVDNLSDYWGIFKIYTDIDEITTETDDSHRLHGWKQYCSE